MEANKQQRILPEVKSMDENDQLKQDAVEQLKLAHKVVEHAEENLEHVKLVLEETEHALEAQRSAESFYRRLGYVPHGKPFEEAGISHLEMRRKL